MLLHPPSVALGPFSFPAPTVGRYPWRVPSWLPLVVSLLALVVGLLALIRANRVAASARRDIARLAAGGTVAAAPAGSPAVASSAGSGLHRVAVVRFDAFADVGGKQSSSAAVLDDEGNGLVITTMHGRDSTRAYVKQVRGGAGIVALSPEESEAVAQAQRDGGAA